MFPILLAQAAPVAPVAELNQFVVIGIVVVGLGSLASLAVSVVTISRLTSGKANERQIEPTQLAALQATFDRYHAENKTELKAQTATLAKLDRESGETKTAVENVAKEVGELKKIQREDVDKMHQRVGGISREVAGTTARVEGLEKRERHKNT